ncbi:MAG: hypothetical protein KDA49_13070 [Rhodospirillaceae bacterium]|nr:hypothetical protein [Rhodospirillaceae bacterium]MCA8933400.1 hypothetical protein [Rhodospirillaceae bacterium]
MSCDLNNLSVLAYANGFTLWHYTTEDVDTDVDDADYFLDARDLLKVGDMILANTETAEASPKGGIFRVLAVSDTSVDVSNMTAVGATNT